MTKKLLSSMLTGALIALLMASAGPAAAFAVNPVGGGNYTKWGASNGAGTAGGVVTWGFIASGTPGSAYCGDACVGSSSLSLPLFYASPGTSNTTTTLNLIDLQPVLQAAFDKWSAVANVTFQYVGIDSSLNAINDPAATSPMIRIGAFSFVGGAANSGAVGYSPPPNGGTGSGDLLFNTGVGYQLASGAEGSALQMFPAGGGYYMNDIKGLALHEIGHTLGLAHSSDLSAVMCGSPLTNCNNLSIVTEQLKLDDINGARFLYGAAPVPEPTTVALMMLGVGIVGMRRMRQR